MDGGRDGLDFYRRIIAGASDYLLPGGLLAFEIGIHQGKAVSKLCQEHGYGVTAVRKDYAGIERMIFAAKEGSVYANSLMAIDQG